MAVIVYSPGYSAPLPGHVFRPDKFRLAFDALLRDGVVSRADVAAPAKLSKKDLLLAHTPGWTRKCLSGRSQSSRRNSASGAPGVGSYTTDHRLRTMPPCSGRFTAADSAAAELKITKAVIRSHLLHAGGTVRAVELALEGGLGINCGGGSHHARAEGGAGFCLVNDLALAARKARKDFGVERTMIVDLDVHQGDGTAAILKGDRSAFTFSMHQADIYPEKKEKSSLDIALPRGTGGAAYLRALRRALPKAMARFRPGLVIYLAGADVCRGDLLGGLALSPADLSRRDACVAGLCLERGIPLVVTLGGGYRKKAADPALLHAATIKAVLSAYK